MLAAFELSLPICAIVFSFLLAIVYFSKKRVKLLENKMYSAMLICVIVDSICVFLEKSFVIGKTIDQVPTYIANIVCIMNKFDASSLIILTSCLFLYIYIVTLNPDKEKFKLVNMLTFILNLIFIIAVFYFDVHLISDGTIISISGSSLYPTYILCSIYTLLSFGITVTNLKNVTRKHIPLIATIIMFVFLIFIFYFNPYLTVISISLTFINFIMYFTIENPDVKMAKELAFQKELQEATSKKTIELIEDMSNDLKSSINKLEAFGNKKIDKNNVDELSKEFEDFQNESINLSNKISGVLDLALIKGETKSKENKYETYDMLDKLNQLLLVEQDNNAKLKIDISKSFPAVLYGDEDNVIRLVIYLYNLLSTINKDKLSLQIDSLEVGRFLRLRFKFNVGFISISNYIHKNADTKELEFRKDDDLNFQIIEKLLKKFNGKIVVSEENKNHIITLNINQRLMTEYEIISNREENKNIKIDYHDFSGKRVLIVDDNKVKIKELKVLLKPYKLEIYDASSPIGVSDLLNKNATFDLVIIDDIISNYKLDEFTNEIIRPKEDLLKTIDQANYPISTIIMVTPNNKNMESKYIKLGFNDYIIKPITKENLDKLLVKNLNKK